MLVTVIGVVAPIFLVAFVVSALSTPVFSRFGPMLGAIDVPGERRIHSGPIPRTGGLAVFAGTYAGLAVVLVNGPCCSETTSASMHWWLMFFAASALVLIAGLIDDVYTLPPVYKLCGQGAAAAIVALGEVQVTAVFGVEISPVFRFAATFLWLLVITNTFNLIDGLDGLATGLAAIASLGIAGTLVFRTLYADALVLVCLVGACLGFFIYNRHPASVFLGDSGSNFLGFFLGTMAMMTGSKSSAVGYVIVPLLAFSVPLLDTLLAIWRRSARMAVAYLLSERSAAGITRGDLDHLHHRLLRKGLSQNDVVSFLHLTSAVLVLVGLITLPYQRQAASILLLTVLAALVILYKSVPMAELRHSAVAVVHGLAYPTKPVLAFILYALLDAVMLTGGIGLIAYLMPSSVLLGWMNAILIWCLAPWTALVIGEYINRRRRGNLVHRLLLLAKMSFAGTMLSMAYSGIIQGSESTVVLKQGLFFAAFVVTSSAVLRVLPAWLGSRSLDRPLAEDESHSSEKQLIQKNIH